MRTGCFRTRGVVEAVVQAIGDSLGSPGTGGRNYATIGTQNFDPPARVIPVAFDRRC